MKKLVSVLMVLGLALAFGACGDDDDDDAATSSTTRAGTDDNGDDAGLLGEGDCAELGGIASRLGQALSPTGASDIGEGKEFFDRISSQGPSEIRADLRVIADLYEAIATVYADVDFDTAAGQPPTQEQIAELAAKFGELQSQFNQEELQTASTNIQEWATEHCDVNPGG